VLKDLLAGNRLPEVGKLDGWQNDPEKVFLHKKLLTR
jgi:hypothetical protein